VTQQSNEHLTDSLLSAYLDQELASEEFALCDAHLAHCASCQNMLADLKLTSALLHSMPQVGVPRSFTLPASASLQTPVPLHRPAHQMRQHPSRLRQAMRAVSVLAAVLGVLLLLIGFASTVSFSRNASSGIATNAASGQAAANQPPIAGSPAYTGNNHTPIPEATSTSIDKGSPGGISASPSVVHQTHTNQPGNGGSNDSQSQAALPTFLDLSQPAGRLSAGAFLLLFGLLGLFLTRRSTSPGRAF
jgi:hypothetical protein